ncbi:histidine kinase N-terminal 7TM domain-containing protein [Niveibacterium terrae]|uniref:histidine kinase N-terminal 7TM domain-containing diguanylate cyclase n=1 Tax=Niveibacterium terrae TaxID=3373598 RepID=UPI003A8FBD7D
MHPIVPVLLSSSSLLLALALLSLNRRFRGSVQACVLLVSIAVYQFGYALELLSTGLPDMLFWSRIQYLGIPFITASSCLFALVMAGGNRPLACWMRGLWLIPAAMSLLRWMDSGYFYAAVTIAHRGGYALLDITPGPVYWAQIVLHYAFSFVACFVMFRLVLRAERHRSAGLICLALTTLLPFFGLFSYLLRLSPFDPLPLILAVSGPLFALGLYRLRLFSLSPVARETLFEEHESGFAVLDAKLCLTDYNAAWLSCFGNEHLDPLGEPLSRFVPQIPVSAFPALGQSFRRIEIQHGGREFSVSLSRLPRRLGWTLAFYETTERKALERRLRQLSFHDALTGLYNRAYLNEELGRLGADDYPLGFIAIDLNGLKAVNDADGHQRGDELIRCAAQAINESVRSADIAARMGGDEFLVLLQRCDAAQLACVEERLRARFSAQPGLSAAFGSAQAGHSGGISAAMQRADEAMYEEKRGGRPEIGGARELSCA